MESITLDEVKEKFAKDNHWLSDWSENGAYSMRVVDEIAKAYAKAKLKEAAENFENEIALKSDYFNHRRGMFNAVKESILKTPLD